ncbi:MAG: class I SAM-dependent methyltransferase, partial [Nocardioidaceae bacterium]
ASAELALLHERILPGGSVFIFFEATRREQVPEMIEKTSKQLVAAGFRVSIIDSQQPAAVGIIGKR